MSAFAKQIPAVVREIRLQFCQTGQPSAGVRSFVQSAYPAVKAAHPDLKFLIREAAQVKPRAFVRFERGVEAQTSLDNLSEKDVGEALTRLVNQQTVGKA